MARHNEILNKFKSAVPVFDFTNKEHEDVVSGASSYSTQDLNGICWESCSSDWTYSLSIVIAAHEDSD